MDRAHGSDNLNQAPIKFARNGSLAGIIVVAWLYGVAPAWAGDGADLGSAQSALNSVCSMFNLSPCPQLPTISQLVIENAALSGSTPAQVRDDLNIPAGLAFDAGTANGVSNPLAFISNPSLALPTLPTNPAANSFLSVTTSGNTLDLKFDYRLRTNSIFAPGQDVGDITLPLTVEDSSGSVLHNPSATVQLRGTGGTSILTDIIADLTGTGDQTYSLSDLGMSASPLDFSSGHLVFNLLVPLIGVGNLIALSPAPGSGFEFANGLFDGIDPIASFFDASLANNSGDLLNAMTGNLAIAFDNTTITSDPVPTPEPTSLALLGGGLLGIALLYRRRVANN